MNEQDAIPDFVEAIVNERTAELRAAFDRQTTRLATLSASERNLAKERNDYKKRAERAEAGWAEAEQLVAAADARVNELLDLLHANEQAFAEETEHFVARAERAEALAAEAIGYLGAGYPSLRERLDALVAERHQ